MSEAPERDEIVLCVPASVEYARIVRVGAAAIALRQGLSFAEIDLLRGAVDTAMLALLDYPAESGAAVACVFYAGGATLQLELRRSDQALMTDAALARLDQAVRSPESGGTVARTGRALVISMTAARP